MSTLREVADHAGVSIATASRVATGSEAVKPETRERVKRAMTELMYLHPRQSGVIGAVGLIVPELENPIFPALAQAMEMRAKAWGFASILCHTDGDVKAESDYMHMLMERQVTGMIFISGSGADLRADHRHYRRLQEEGASLVFVNGAPNSIDAPAVGIDERAAGALATNHLIELGHTRIGFVAGPEHFVPTRQKAEGRDAALAAASLPTQTELVAHDSFSVEGGKRALAKLLSLAKPPTAVICSSDLMAVGALQQAYAQKLRVPEDLSLVGFDGVSVTNWTQPPLTTIEQPIADMAEMAVNALWSLTDEPDRHVPNFLFRPRLRAGGSTCPPDLSRGR
jgi:DNA-binding LacI/PurR family transcriptional regulator